VAHEFDEAMLANLVNAGLVSLLAERVLAGGRLVDVARIRSRTQAGRRRGNSDTKARQPRL
jgi:hypothetical protein